MPNRRILSLWFPRLGAERLLRFETDLVETPFAIAEDRGPMQVLSSLSSIAHAAGLRRDQPLRDALAMCPDLITRLRNPQAETAFLATLRRWAGKFSPWVAEEAPDALIVDLTGCAHLFGGEAALVVQVIEECEALGLTVQTGIADTAGAAWALARFAGQAVPMTRSGDAIDQEAYATRSRAAKRRHWERGGPAPPQGLPDNRSTPIAPPGQTRSALAPLPVAALRLPPEMATDLTRLGLRRIGDLTGQPRAALGRRFGRHLVQRLDQALGVEPEPISPAKPPMHFAVRLTLPDPIGLEADIAAALDRLLPRLSEQLVSKGRGARRVRLECHRADHTMQGVEVGLARPSAAPDRIRPLLLMKLSEIDAGFGIDRVRIEAVVTEPLHDRQFKGHADAAADAVNRLSGNTALEDLIGRIGARIGLEAITRLHPADSHIPEKAVKVMAAAWSEPARDWPTSPVPRPLVLWRPELVTAEDVPDPPLTFRWRRQSFETLAATGPERIAPEWWLDEPDWRTGVRDYWRITTTGGVRLWLYYAHGAAMSAGWFCQGAFE
ncbi:MAG: DNA polymerase Y family protein [Rhodobacteraceae bacterium]|nr:DNA polymerase Y family protein [Paracoccaceae bacterium]